ncbi:MAG: hypothetical protein RI556_12285 [Hydrogenovibrio sp.]|uniref:recombination directionality factor n=1 Tax=Hydrogenovibrio sp. TaxID=2065821 RepID=UPI0028708FF1|nr:hypothetical protein [Hydrogenovibrio sp.]MDR9499947.1 hypothetical protein [Hydrogenovibrio sp.]
MLKGLMLTPPVLGRIAIGQVVERNGKRLPQKDDQFTLTSQVQNAEGWKKHPLDGQLRQARPNQKLREIPVHLLFNDPDLNLRAEYSLFDRQNGRPVCVGDGETCQRRTPNGMETLPCPSPEGCEFSGGLCKPFGRLNVVVESADVSTDQPSSNKPDSDADPDDGSDGVGQALNQDPLGTFIFRTTGFNSIRTLAARLQYFAAISNKRLACLPLALKLRGKSTRQSFGRPIFYVDLTLREGWSLHDTLAQAKALDEQRQAMGYDQQALDRAARKGYQRGAFEESAEEAQEVIEEFYPGDHQGPNPSHDPQGSNNKVPKTPLNQAIHAQLQQTNHWLSESTRH